MNDIDTSSKLSRDAHEEFAAPVLDHIALALRQTPAESGVSIDACAFFSPTFRIREFRISAITPYDQSLMGVFRDGSRQ